MPYMMWKNWKASKELRQKTGLTRAELNEKFRQIQAGEIKASEVLGLMDDEEPKRKDATW